MMTKNQEIYFGLRGSADFIKDNLRKNRIKRALLVCGKSSFKKSGAAKWLLPVLNGIDFEVYNDFSENPDIAELKKAINKYPPGTFDGIIGVGGGTSLDMAKLIAFFGASGLQPDKYLDDMPNVEFDFPYIMAIPTTAGSGSEATSFAVLYRGKKKYSIPHPGILPDVAIIIPELTYSMSPYLTACTGLDALAQGIESYWAVGATKDSKKYAREAIKISLKYLIEAVNNPNVENRRAMAKAANLAGKAINISKTTICHALSYPVTSYYGYPHGHAVSLFLPEIIKEHINREIVSTGFLNLFANANPVDSVKKIIKGVGLNIHDMFKNSDVNTIVSMINSERLKNNPVQFSSDELKNIVYNSLIRV